MEYLPQKKFARYGPLDRYEEPPKAGMCLSAFALVQREGLEGMLFGLPRPNKRWMSDWMSSWRSYSEEEMSAIYQEWRLPSSYLLEGEHPLKAIRRIMTGQLGIRNFKITDSPSVFSYVSPSSWYEGNNHWDFAVVYPVTIRSAGKNGLIENQVSRGLWRELRFIKSKKELRTKDFGWNADLIKDLKLI